MEAAELAGHVVAVSVLMLVGVPTNAVVIWIYTRSKSHLTHNKFPLIFAAIDLVAILLLLPLFAVAGQGVELTSLLLFVLHQFYRVFAHSVVNAYFAALLMSSVDKLYAVTFPFDYKLKRELFVKVTVVLAGPIDLAVSGVLASPLLYDVMTIFKYIYNGIFFLMFLTTILLYVIIVVRSVQTERDTQLKIQSRHPK